MPKRKKTPPKRLPSRGKRPPRRAPRKTEPPSEELLPPEAAPIPVTGVPAVEIERKPVHPPASVPARKTPKDKFEKALSVLHPRVSVIIASHNSVDTLWHCLFALKTQSFPIHEILLVDNASEDASLTFVRSNYPKVKILECQEDFGPTMAFNLGVKTATGDLVLLVSPDMVLAPKGLTHMVRDLQNYWPKYGAITAPLLQAQEGEARFREEPRTLNILGNPMEGYFQETGEVFNPQRGPVLFPRFLAPEGPFDSDLFSGFEGAYMGWRLHLQHHATLKAQETKVYLKISENPPDLPEWKSIFFQTRNRWFSLLVFYEKDHLVKVLPWVVLEALWRQIRSLVVGFSPFWGNLCAMGWILLNLGGILKKRQAIQETRKAGDRECLCRMSGRLVRDRGYLSRILNFLSLAYCRITGVEILEWQD